MHSTCALLLADLYPVSTPPRCPSWQAFTLDMQELQLQAWGLTAADMYSCGKLAWRRLMRQGACQSSSPHWPPALPVPLTHTLPHPTLPPSIHRHGPD